MYSILCTTLLCALKSQSRHFNNRDIFKGKVKSGAQTMFLRKKKKKIVMYNFYFALCT